MILPPKIVMSAAGDIATEITLAKKLFVNHLKLVKVLYSTEILTKTLF